MSSPNTHLSCCLPLLVVLVLGVSPVVSWWISMVVVADLYVGWSGSQFRGWYQGIKCFDSHFSRHPHAPRWNTPLYLQVRGFCLEGHGYRSSWCGNCFTFDVCFVLQWVGGSAMVIDLRYIIYAADYAKLQVSSQNEIVSRHYLICPAQVLLPPSPTFLSLSAHSWTCWSWFFAYSRALVLLLHPCRQCIKFARFFKST